MNKVTEKFSPMVCESSREKLEKKKKKWIDIFQQHPDFADYIISLRDNHGDEIYNKLVIIVNY